MENHKEKQSIVQAQLTKSTSTGKLTKPDVQIALSFPISWAEVDKRQMHANIKV